ncbi:DUF2330 domain-containing protein [Persicimonas caeni]|uniref:DUF2330 domain-containing protein n=1 Tax=Persicimonas caeni TaxID=2292766 RepID=A0A4Y6PPZ7_PERCE|nr:DUF2330 domain-containing protein [Persicimonas caeni]QDG50406.1 DUF2330 domain-containing protein [Persicimonas caeni]QED31627.1 DUF2330 domain-containing protein [Persicimonas caeni]
MPLNIRNRLAICAMTACAFAGITAAAPQTAEACGGFFCNSQQPVNQQAERIIFSQNTDGTVSAVVQIMYQGPASEFAWLLPVSGSPEVSVSSNAAFQRLQNATAPTYRLNTTIEGDCAQPDWDNAGGGVDAGTSADAGAGGGGGGVTVVNQGAVGPYNYTTISVDSGTSDPAQAAIDWLTQNNYDVTNIGADLIRPYLEDGMNIIAFKLTKSKDAGDIRPVKLTYPAELPMIPIKLTAVAANDDMGVLVWVLGESRAIASNYRSLVLNDALINWFNPTSNYDDVVTQAANEANGQGFVTEYADGATNVDGVIFSDGEFVNWSNINDPSQWQDDHGELIMEVLRSYGTFDGFNLVVDETVPLPSGSTTQDFLNCPSCVFNGSSGGSDAGFGTLPAQIDGFSPDAFLSAVEEHVITPMQETEALVDSRPYITRMYTTMSAGDMTLDPVFDFNDTLGNVSNQHVADRTIYCSQAVTVREAPWKAVLPSGEEVHGQGASWPLSADDGLPANRQVRQEHNTGSGDTIEDNTDSIATTIAEHNATVSLDPGEVDNGGDAAGGDVGAASDAGAGAGGDSDSGCSATGTGVPVGGALAVALLLGVARLRRREVG